MLESEMSERVGVVPSGVKRGEGAWRYGGGGGPKTAIRLYRPNRAKADVHLALDDWVIAPAAATSAALKRAVDANSPLLAEQRNPQAPSFRHAC